MGEQDILFLQSAFLLFRFINLTAPTAFDFDPIRPCSIPLPDCRCKSKCNTQSIFLGFFQSSYFLTLLLGCFGWIVVGFISGVPVDIFVFLPSTLRGVYC
jgi:hypothetical protein